MALSADWMRPSRLLQHKPLLLRKARKTEPGSRTRTTRLFVNREGRDRPFAWLVGKRPQNGAWVADSHDPFVCEP
jgi:hypothetical protein